MAIVRPLTGLRYDASRVGDVGLSIAVMLMFVTFGTFSFGGGQLYKDYVVNNAGVFGLAHNA